MDRRCLYGHRVNASFRHCIDNDQCPVCGAEMISLDGYKLARQLAQAVPLDGTAAFRAVKVLEGRFKLVPIEATKGAAASAPPPVPAPAAVPSGTEVLLDEEELASESVALVSSATPGDPLVDELADDESVELIAAEVTDESEPERKAEGTERRSDPGFSAEEDAFFASSP